MNKQTKTVVIGAGVAGLTTAALLLEAGHDVTVLEAQAYPGGCAGTFFYQGYRFDAGATLAGGFAAGGPHHQVAQRLGIEWPVEPVTPIAWTVHLPDGRAVSQWTEMERWREARQTFPNSERFWRKQEQLADIAWDVSTRHFPWPPQDVRDLVDLGRAIRPKTLPATPYILSSIGSFMPKNDPMLRTFIDANLLISAQATADHANALYGSAALELPRRGVSHVKGGIGGIADTLVEWIRVNGGTVLFKQSVDKIETRNGNAVAVHTNQHKRRKSSRLTIECDTLIANVTPWGLQKLLNSSSPSMLDKEIERRNNTWGAFMLYVGLDESLLPPDMVEHHQVVRDHTKPLGETNSIFISVSAKGEMGRAPLGMRAPAGRRAANISTHTQIEPWWALRNAPDRKQAYLERRAQYVEAMLDSAEIAIPNFKQAAKLILPATPVTYEQWTGRPMGMVGGFPQTSILNARGPQTGLANCWLVGDSVFPGQSTAGVTLSALRVVEKVRQTIR